MQTGWGKKVGKELCPEALANDWTAEASFAKDGYGGKVDLHHNMFDGVVLDFKTKDVEDQKKMRPYATDVMQHAAYRHGLGLPNAKCYSLFINVRHPGMLYMHEWPEEEVVKGYKMFCALKDFWYLKNGMSYAG